MYKISTNFHQFSFLYDSFYISNCTKGTRATLAKKKLSAGKRQRHDKKISYARAISINRAGDEFVCACRTCDEIRNQKCKKKREKRKT